MTGFAAIGLVRPKTPANIGAVLRAAGCYGAAMVVIAGERGHRMAAHCPTDTHRSVHSIPTVMVDEIFQAHQVGSIPVAVDLVEGAVSLVDFVHPPRAYYIFGPEDGTLGKSITDRCLHKVMIPTFGCLNLAATVNTVLYDRMAKAARR